MPSPAPRVVLITGVTRGLGRAMAEGFIAQGHTVIGCGRNAGDVQALASGWGNPHRVSAVDVADDAQVSRWAREVMADSPPPDLLLNNAALVNRNAPLWELSAAEFDAVVDVNVKGTANVIRHFVPPMVARGKGIIVNFSSGWGRSTSPEVAPYCATKYAIEGLTQALAQELPKGMAAIPLNPGIINTDMLRSCFGKQAHHYPTATEWARTAVPFLLRLSSRSNGESLTVQ